MCCLSDPQLEAILQDEARRVNDLFHSPSWEGLPREVIIADWNGGKARDSLAWFARRGHRQVIVGYYDVDDLSGLAAWKSAARGVNGVFGFMYTRWEAKYGLLERYGQ